MAVTLGPGTYDLIFGSGAFGATGSAYLNECCSGDPGTEMLIKGNFPVAWSPDPQAYLFVNGVAAAATPEPLTAALFGGGLIALSLFGKRLKEV
jgi:hypothetical protein